MQSRYPYFVKILDKDPKTSVQYYSDWNIRDDCFCLAHGLSEFCQVKGKVLSSEDYGLIIQELYNLNQNVFPKYFVNDCVIAENLQLYLDYMNLLFEEHKYRFKEDHVSSCKLPLLNKIIPLLLKTRQVAHKGRLDLDTEMIPEKYLRDDFNEPFKQKYKDVRRNDGSLLTKSKLNKPSLVNSMRYWYKYDVLATQLSYRYTGRQLPPFLMDEMPRAHA